MKTVHTVAVILSIIGALLVAIRYPLAGHVIWVPANALWIWWAKRQKDWRTFTLFAVYFVLTCVGIVRWWA